MEKLKGPPAIIMGGHANSLAVARSLGRRGVKVYALAHPGWVIRHSRYVELIDLGGEWSWDRVVEFLLGTESDPYAGSVLLTGTDEGLEILTENRDRLAGKFLLDRCNPDAQQRLLDKVTTYEAATACDVPTPKYWLLDDDGFDAVAEELCFPMIVKPRLAHESFAVLKGKKFLFANDVDEARAAVHEMTEGGVASFLVELIPGPDSQLCSYYTYLDESGHSYFDYTKRVIRRFPKNMGLGTCHISDEVEGLRDISLRLFRHVGLHGLANVEYKIDPRDGVPKLIECNARFTGATSLLTACGLDLPSFVYRQVVGLPLQEVGPIRHGRRLWDPARDWAAFKELRELGELSAFGWLKSVLRPQQLPLWSWRDPRPSLIRLASSLRGRLRRPSANGQAANPGGRSPAAESADAPGRVGTLS